MTCIKRTNWVVNPIYDDDDAMPKERGVPQDFDSIYGQQFSDDEGDDYQHEEDSYEEDEPAYTGSSGRRRTSVELGGGHSRTSRRLSVGGTTLYETPHMAKVDSFLQKSGLRLKTDGTCNFLFDSQRFVIETTDETGDFLFYACLGKLKELKRHHPDKNLLRLLAHWNEVQTNQNGGDEEGEGGLLRIDSSKPDGPHVSFIYYGHIDEIPTAKEFQMLLDRFVDDAIEFSFKLNPTLAEGTERTVRSSSNQSISSKSHRTQSTCATTSSLQSDGSDGSAAMPSVGSVGSSAPPSGNSMTSAPSTTSSGQAGAGKKSVFTKMIKTLRNKSSDKNVAAMAFIDPGNKSSPFVVDKHSEEKKQAPPPAPHINLSRKGDRKKGSSFHHPDNHREHERPRRKGSSFHGDHDRSSSLHFGEERDHRPHRKRSSILDEHEHDRPSRKGSSFHVEHLEEFDDVPRRKGSSFHIDSSHHSSHSDARRKCKSFHNSDDFSHRKHHKNRRSTMNSEDSFENSGNSLNKSYDVFNRSEQKDMVRDKNSQFACSEPCVTSRQGITTTAAFKATPIVHKSRMSSHPDHRRKTLTDIENPLPPERKSQHRERRRGSVAKTSQREHRRGGGAGKRAADKATYRDDDGSECSWE